MRGDPMSASRTLAKIIRVSIEKDSRGVFVATSPNLNGLLVVSKDLNSLLDSKISEAISALYEACGVRVAVARADDGQDEAPWVAMPMEVLRKAETEFAKA